ncbi:MAG: aminoglycoside phosphotransferase family protein [Bacteroidales bacterium]|nr:aminoglycoside phosphotransferase family protein [Bacteroidales bacterium]
MQRNIYRGSEYSDRLREFIYEKYDIRAISIAPAKRGFYGETWRLNTLKNSYFVKIVYWAAHCAVYERSFPIIKHLCNHGIDFICKITETKDGRLFSKFDGAILGVFNWIDGENIETDDTKIPEYQMLAKIYNVPAQGLPIICEDFSAKGAEIFFKQWACVDNEELKTLLEKNRAKLEHRAARLKWFSGLCQNDTESFVITHGDAGGNLIKDKDKYFIVDWDNPVFAPPERDAWVMCSRSWARDAFQSALQKNGINYTLRIERLAYYCYQFFFFYLSSYIDGFTENDSVQEIEKYLDCWIEDSIAYTDKI